MKKLHTFLIVVLFLIGFSDIKAQQEVLYLDAVNPVFSVIFPNDWKVGAKEGKYIVSPPAKDLDLRLWEVKNKNMEDALTNLPDLVKDFVNAPNFSNPKEIKKKRVDLTEVKGSGKDKSGKNVDVVVSLFESRKRVLVVVCYADSRAMGKYQSNLDGIMNSIATK